VGKQSFPDNDDDTPVDRRGQVVIKPTTNSQQVYLQYERLHRTHPHWPLSDLMGMTPRQRKYWLAMGKQRAEQRQREMQRILERGQSPVG
jgi:hypothetical protein